MSAAARAALGWALACALVAPGAARGEVRVVVLPFEDLGERRAAAPMVEALMERLARAGYAVSAGPLVEEFLERRRIRYLDSLTADALRELLEAFQAQRVVFGTVLLAFDKPVPYVAAHARMIGAEAKVFWAELVSLGADETRGAFDLGGTKTLEELCRVVARRLVQDLPRPEAPPQARPGPPPRALATRAVKAWRSPELRGVKELRVCVLPPWNRTDSRWAARVATELVTRRLAATRIVRVIEPADMRQAALAGSARLAGGGEPNELRKIGERLGVDYFVKGTLFALEDRLGADGRVALELTLLDARTGRILWTAFHDRAGDPHLGLLERSAMQDPVTVADQAIAEMISTLSPPR